MELRGPNHLQNVRREVPAPDAELRTDGTAGYELQDEPAAPAAQALQHEADGTSGRSRARRPGTASDRNLIS
jgi:hypothetical protein